MGAFCSIYHNHTIINMYEDLLKDSTQKKSLLMQLTTTFNTLAGFPADTSNPSDADGGQLCLYLFILSLSPHH